MSKKEEKVIKDYTYFHERLDPLGWTKANGSFTTPNWQFRAGRSQPIAKGQHDYREYTYDLFDVDEHGNLVINYYRITGARTTYRKGDGPARNYTVTRFRNPPLDKNGKPMKYASPAGGGTFPWIPPQLIEAYREGTPLDTLNMIEGPLKAYALTNAGSPTIGLTGITQGRDRDKSIDQLHVDIVDLIQKCTPKKVNWVVDGDCTTIPSKWPEGDPDLDLFKRPNDFFSSAKTMRDLLQDLSGEVGFSMWFRHVESLSVEVPARGTPPKGADDLLLAVEDLRVREAIGASLSPDWEQRTPEDQELVLQLKGWAKMKPAAREKALKERRVQARKEAHAEVVKELHSITGGCTYFYRKSLDKLNEVRKYFAIGSAAEFYSEFSERIGDRPFVFNGTQWQHDGKELVVILPAVMRNYVRVGDTYYERVPVPNRFNQLEEKFHPRLKGTIVEDHGKEKLKHVMKLKAFCNVPNHEDYQQILHGCMNRYRPFEHQPEPGDFPHIRSFMEHIFGAGELDLPHPKKKDDAGVPLRMKVNEVELGYDYMQLLVQDPIQILPILCLVSKKRQTGKTTFAKLIKAIFTGNAAFISSSDLQNDFNEHWLTKLVVICEEAFIEKKASIEKIKDLSTASVAMMNTKGVAQQEIEVFLKFILCSNNVRNFINTDGDEIRFWVRDIPQIKEELLNPDLEKFMYEEIPQFLHFLSKRTKVTERLSRMWFHQSLLETEALRLVRDHSVPTLRRSIEGYIKGMFYATRKEEILMCNSDIRAEACRGLNADERYVKQTLDDMGVEPWRNAKGVKATRTYSYYRIVEKRDESILQLGFIQDLKEVRVNIPGRPYHFQRHHFIDDATWELTKPSAEDHVASPAERTAQEVAAAMQEPEPDDLPF